MPDTIPARPLTAAQLAARMRAYWDPQATIVATALRAAPSPLGANPQELVTRHLAWHVREIQHLHTLGDQPGVPLWRAPFRRRQGTIDFLFWQSYRLAAQASWDRQRQLLPPAAHSRAAKDRLEVALAQAEALLPPKGRLHLYRWWGSQRHFQRAIAEAAPAYAALLEPLLLLERHTERFAALPGILSWHAQALQHTSAHPWSRFNHYARVILYESLPLLEACFVPPLSTVPSA